MIIATHGIIASSGGVAYDADAIAFFNRVTTAGGSLSLTEMNATNQLVLDMKSASIWTSMKAIYPMVGASSAACAQNLKSSSFTGTFSTGWTFESTGVTPNGTSAFMDTNFNVNTSGTLNSFHLSYYSRTNNNSSAVQMGCQDASQTFLMANFGANRYSGLNAGGGTLVAVLANTLGLIMDKRENNTTIKTFQNGSLLYSTINVTTAKPNVNLYLSAYNNNGSAIYCSLLQNAFSTIGDGLTDTQASNLYTAVQAFQTTLSRQV